MTALAVYLLWQRRRKSKVVEEDPRQSYQETVSSVWSKRASEGIEWKGELHGVSATPHGTVSPDIVEKDGREVPAEGQKRISELQ